MTEAAVTEAAVAEAAVRPRRARSKAAWRGMGRWVVILLGLPFALFPVYWMITSAFKSSPELLGLRPTLYPHEPSLDQFREALADGTLLASIVNSAVVGLSASVVVLVVGSGAAYAATHWKFPGVGGVMKLTLFTQLLPGAATCVPIYLLWSKLGIVQSLGGLGLLYSILNLPVAVWMLIGFFRSMPYELTEAALVDGASRPRILWSIILPVARPSLVAVGVYTLIGCWGEFFFATIFLSRNARTSTVALAAMIGQHDPNIGPLMAASVIMSAVPLVFFFAMQRQFVSGLTSGAVKT
ncbi:MAG: carbohydrate ABC transporter permease [Propionibacteriaceae bacterium]|jgi:ABC-type glycerol-3-phosphate transport system permease component|nr:carbohydrate ABC transporter permease [Propionibacteriaceae bacterium]